jgi:hypothetical protein
MPNYKILVLTSDNYSWAILPYAWLLKKYWPDHPEVIVGGFTPPNFTIPPGFSFLSLGAQRDYPIDKWSNAFYKLINEANQEVFIFMLEDMWIIQDVNVHVVNMAYDYMEQFGYVARLDLTGDRLHATGASLYGKLGNYDLIWSSPDSPYHMSTMPAFWRAEHLRKVLIPNETPWDLEIKGTPRLASHGRDLVVVGTNAWPIKNTLAFRGGDVSKLLLDEVDENDVREMNKLGLLRGGM